MRSLRVLGLVACCAGCNVVYDERTRLLPYDATYYGFDRRAGFDLAPPRDVGARDDTGDPIGQPCDDASCPYPLRCASRGCGSERACAAPVTLCAQSFEPVCDCHGATLQNECAARAQGSGVAYAGACDGRPTDDAGLDASVDAAVDAAPNRCASTACDDGYVCCAEPTSPAYGRCQPLACDDCCRRAE